MEQNTAIVNMNWVHVTQRLAREFGLPGCFVLDTKADAWVGMQPPKTFRNYLSNLFKVKEASYFKEIRFYKYNEETKESGKAENMRYLALIPVSLKGVAYNFLGLLYDSPDKLQELLRQRIMPNYTLFWLYQLVAEARVRNANEKGQKALLKALDEQRLYAKQLESKVEVLHEEIHSVKTAEMTLDQKVDKLTSLLDRQMTEYDALANNYQQIFLEHQALQEDFLGTCVRMETRINELEGRLISQELLDDKEVQAEEESKAEDKPKITRRLNSMMERLQNSTQNLVKLQNEYKSLKDAYGGVTPEQVTQMMEAMADQGRRLTYFKNRTEEQEQELKRLKMQAIAARRSRG